MTRAALAYLAVYLAWGSTYLGIKLGIQDFSPGGMSGLRFLLASLLMFAIWRLRGGSKVPAGQAVRAASIGTVMLAGGTGFLSYAERVVPSGVAALVIGCSPLFFALFNRLAGGTPLTRAQALGGLTALAGVAWLSWGSGHGLGGPLPLEGLALIGAGIVCWTGSSVIAQRLDLPSDSFATAAYQNLAAGAFLLGFAAARGEFTAEDLLHPPAATIAAILYLAAVGSLIGFTAYTWLLKNEPANRVSSYAFVNPVVAVLLGSLFGGEPLTLPVVGATALVVGGVSFSMLTHPVEERQE